MNVTYILLRVLNSKANYMILAYSSSFVGIYKNHLILISHYNILKTSFDSLPNHLFYIKFSTPRYKKSAFQK